MKKINFFIPSFAPGGAEKVCITLANELSSRYSITLYVCDNEGPLKSEVGPGVLVQTLRYKRSSANILEIRKILKSDLDAYNLVFLTHQILSVLQKLAAL